MNIGEAASWSGLPPKTIRYYEDCGLLWPATRTANGYRRYTIVDLHMLAFVKRARGLGFTMGECRELLDIYRDRSRSSSDVKSIAQRRIEEIDRKIAELQSIRATLSDLIERCHGDDRPECPIIEELGAVPAQYEPHGVRS